MYPQQFALISKAYTEEISLQKDGSQITREFTSECTYNEDRTFQTVGTFIPKLVPKHFVTTLTVADELVYYESIAFERRTVLKNYSETTNIFLPKEKTYKYRSSLVFQPNHVKKYYKVGTELLPAQKYDATEELNHLESGAPSGCGDKCAVNGDINGYPQLINGEA